MIDIKVSHISLVILIYILFFTAIGMAIVVTQSASPLWAFLLIPRIYVNSFSVSPDDYDTWEIIEESFKESLEDSGKVLTNDHVDLFNYLKENYPDEVE